MRIIFIFILLGYYLCAGPAFGAIIQGNPSGHVTLIEVFDYQCAYCHLDYKNILKLIDKNPNLQIRLMPVAVENSLSIYEGAAAIASTQYPGKFQILNNIAMESTPLNKNQIDATLKTLNLTSTAFQNSMHSMQVESQFNQGLKFLTLEKSGTPLFIIFPTRNPRISAVLRGYQSYKTLQKAVDEAGGDA